MRLLLILHLIGLMAICPSLCGTGQMDRCAQAHHAGEDVPQDGTIPFHDTDGCNACMCQGAIQPDDLRLDLAGSVDLIAPFGGSGLVASPPPSPDRDRPAIGLTSRPDHATLQAWLQTFRC